MLAIKPVDFEAGEPTFKYRGMFHDDEDVYLGVPHQQSYMDKVI